MKKKNEAHHFRDFIYFFKTSVCAIQKNVLRLNFEGQCQVILNNDTGTRSYIMGRPLVRGDYPLALVMV